MRHHFTESNAEWAGAAHGRRRQCLAVRVAVLWIPIFLSVEDSEGVVHEVLQGEGGEQGDALMPALYSLGQHDALVAIQGRLAQDERLMAFLDDIYAVGDRPERSGAAHTAIQEELRTHTGIEVHQGKTQLWNRAGVAAPAGSAALTAAAQVADPSAIVWRGDPHLPPEEQGVKILGTPLGHPSCVRSQSAALTAKHEHLISNILQVQDLQCAWILLLYCASARANYALRVVHPKLTDAFAAQHDASMRRALSQLLSVDPSSMYWDVASLPFTRGGMGLRSAALTSRAAYWSSLGGLFGDDCRPKSRCGRHDRHRDGSGRRRVPCQWSI